MPFTEDAIVDIVRSADLTSTESARQAMTKIATYTAELKAKVDAGEKTEAKQNREIEKMAQDMRELQMLVAKKDAEKARKVDDNSAVLRKFIGQDGRLVRGSSALVTDQRAVQAGLLNSKPLTEEHRSLILACEDHYLAVTFLYGARGFVGNDYDLALSRNLPTWEKVQAAWKAMPEFLTGKAWDGGTGTGGEFIPVPTLTTVFSAIAENDPMGWMNVIPVLEMSSYSAKIPMLLRLPAPYVQAAATGDYVAAGKRSSVATTEVSPELADIYCMSGIHRRATIGSVTEVLPFLREQLAKGLTIAERLIQVNGATAGSQDALSSWNIRGFYGAIADSGDHFLRAANGLRQIAIARSNTVDRSTTSLSTTLEDMTELTGPVGSIDDHVLVTSPEGYLKNYVGMSGVISVSDYGNRQPIAAGEIGTLAGRRVIQVDAITTDLNESGVFDNITTTKTGSLLFNRQNLRRLRLAGQSMAVTQWNDEERDMVMLRGKAQTGLQVVAGPSDKIVRYMYNQG